MELDVTAVIALFCGLLLGWVVGLKVGFEWGFSSGENIKEEAFDKIADEQLDDMEAALKERFGAATAAVVLLDVAKKMGERQ